MSRLNGLSECLGSNAYALEEPLREKRRYEEYVAERRNLDTVELKRRIISHDRGHFRNGSLRNLICRLFSDTDYLLRIKATRQVLEERSEQSFFET